MLKALGRIAVQTAIPKKGKNKSNPAVFPTVNEIIPAPSRKLVKHYVRWSNASVDRYSHYLPPHMFTQFALPICVTQLEMTRYNLGSIINQGCGMTIYDNIAMGEDLKVSCEVADITEENGRARVHQKLTIGTQQKTKAIEVDFYTAFIIGKSEKSPREEEQKPSFRSLGSWNTTSNDGLEFGILTGDLNPIHWVAPVAKMSPFKNKVLHGFGMFVRTFETIQNSTNEKIQSIDVRFISPVVLPSKGNEVWISEKQGDQHLLEQRDPTGKIQMIGHLTF